MRISLERFEELSCIAILAMKTRYEFDVSAAQQSGALNVNRLDKIRQLTAKLDECLTIAERGDS